MTIIKEETINLRGREGHGRAQRKSARRAWREEGEENCDKILFQVKTYLNKIKERRSFFKTCVGVEHKLSTQVNPVRSGQRP